MSSHLASPCMGDLKQVFRIFAYLKKYHNAELVFDPTEPVIDEALFDRCDWSISEFGHLADAYQEVPPNMPVPHGQGFVRRAKVDADHVEDTIT